MQFRIHAQATRNNIKVSPLSVSTETFSASSKSSYCNLQSSKMIVSIDTSKIDHIDNVVVTLSAVEENTTNTFASVDIMIGKYRDQRDNKKWSCCTKKNKYQTATKTPSLATRGRLKFGHDEETRKLKRQTVDNNQSNDLEKQIARWRTGYIVARWRTKATSYVPTQLTNNNAIIDSSAINNTDIIFTLKTLMRTQQQSSNDELQRINIESDRKRYEKDRKTLIIIIGIVVLFLVVGAIFYPLVEDWTVIDSLYFGVVTLTTVGYGDMGPTTDVAKIFTALYVFFGVAIVATCIGVATTFIIQASALKKEIEKRERREKMTDDSDDDSDSDDEFEDEDQDTSVIVPIDQGGKNDSKRLKRCCSHCLKRSTFFFHEFLPAFICCSFGILFMCMIENISFVDAFYWSIVTGTTVGYGDVSPSVPLTRGFALFYLFAAVITMGKALSAFGSLLDSDDGHESQLLNKKLDEKFLISLDQDGTGEVSEFEYLSAMLVLLEYVEQDDIDRVMNSFRKLDVDGSGSLTVDDLKLNLTSHVNHIQHNLKKPKKVFRDCDTNGNGSLEPSEVRAALKMLGSQMTDQEFEVLYTAMDKDLDGHISYIEFKRVLYQRIVYETIDDDVNGSLNRAEIRESFEYLFELTINDDDFEVLYNELEKDQNGDVNFKEFKKFFKHSKAHKKKILSARVDAKITGASNDQGAF